MMDPLLVQEFELQLDKWLVRGYRILADEIDGELRLTAHYVSPDSGRGSEREQQFWPFTPELVRLLVDSGIPISHGLAGPRPWQGPHPGEDYFPGGGR